MTKDQMTHKSYTVDVYTDKGFFCAEVSYPSAVSDLEKIQIIAGCPWELAKKLQDFFNAETTALHQEDRKKYLGIAQ